MPSRRGPYATFSNIDIGNGFGFWKTRPTRRRNSTTFSCGSLSSSSSSITLPLTRALGIRSFMRLKQRSTVLLPLPEGPRKATNSRGPMLKLTFSSTWTLP